MPKTIPMIITNKDILIKDKDTDEFKAFQMPGIESVPNIPFYHMFAQKISECQYYFKEFIKKIYGKKLSRYVFAIVTPDDTTPLESIFINEFFLNSDTCKAVAQITMGQALSKTHSKYISISKSSRNIVLQYINNNEVRARKLYDCNDYDVKTIIEDAKRLHIDVEYSGMHVFVNNFNMNMDEFSEMGIVITPKDFMDKIAVIDVEKV
ncbi:MAG: hypothetical protein ACLUFN_05560 [Eubacterium sp.]